MVWCGGSSEDGHSKTHRVENDVGDVVPLSRMDSDAEAVVLAVVTRRPPHLRGVEMLIEGVFPAGRGTFNTPHP